MVTEAFTAHERELQDISEVLYSSIQARKDELIGILSQEDYGRPLRNFVAGDGDIFLQACKNKELPPSRAKSISKKIIGGGLDDIYSIARLVETQIISYDTGVGILLENMKYSTGGFLCDIYEKYLKANQVSAQGDKKLIKDLRSLSEYRKGKNLPPSCPLSNLPGVKGFMRKLLNFFIKEIVPKIKNPSK